MNLIYADEWTFVPLVERLYLGTLTAGDLFRSNNEHIFLFPKLVILVLARLTHYNAVAEMYFSLAIASFALFLIFRMYVRDFGASSASLLQFAPISWLFFTLRQEENLQMGLQVNVYLGVAGFVAAIHALEKEKIGWLAIAVCAGVVSTFSNANGLLVWPAGVIFLLLSGVKRKRLSLILWLLAAALISGFYLSQLKAGHGASISFTARDLVSAPLFFLLNIGSPLAFVKSSAIGLGAATAFFLAAALVLGIRNGAHHNAKWVAFVLFSVGASVFFTAGRVNFGLWAALASRYVTVTVIGIIGAYMVIVGAYRRCDEQEKQKFALLYGAILTVVLIGIVSGYAGGLARGQETHEARKRVAAHLLDYSRAPDEELEPILYDLQKVRESAVFLERYKLNVFRHKSP